MNSNVINTPFKKLDNKHNNKPEDNMTKTYEIKLSLTPAQISEILDYRLGQKIEHDHGNIESLLNTAECIKSSKLSDEFCRFFASELTPLVNNLISNESDSYEITNFQHRMLRKFANCAASKKTA